MTDQDEKWNYAIDLVVQSLNRPDSEIRAEMRGEKCCTEVYAVREEVFRFLRGLRRGNQTLP